MALAFKKAIRAYVVLRIRMRELKAFLLIATLEKRYPVFFKHGLLQNNTYLGAAIFGWTYSLMDGNNGAASLLAVWRVIFPQEVARVDAFEIKFADELNTLKSYRDTTAFHGNQNMTRYISGTRNLCAEMSRMGSFFSEFERLNAVFLSMDSQIAEPLEQVLHEVAKSAKVDVEEIRQQMYWPATS